MSNKIAIVTGANTGLGFELTKLLVAAKYEVVMACRSFERGQAALDQINITGQEITPVLMQLDLSDLQSVRGFASKFKQHYSSLSLLVNNAGLSMDFKSKFRCETTDGFELTIGTNHLGHFLLTHLLLDVIKETAKTKGEARIVNVTSMMHQYGGNRRPMKDHKPMDFEDMMMEKEDAYNGQQAYKNSKAMNVFFTKRLSKEMAGTNVTVNCICPGFVPTTEFMRHASGFTVCLLTCCLPCLACFGITRSVSTASRHMFDLCDDPELKGVTGEWFTDGRRTETSPETCVEANQDFVWDWSWEKCGL